MIAEQAGASLAEDGVCLWKGVVSNVLLDALREAVAANRAAARPMSRQVLNMHGPAPADRPPRTAVMDQWLSSSSLDGPGSTRIVADALRRLAADLLGELGVLVQDLLLIQREGQRAFLCNQDFGYWPVDRPLGVLVSGPLQPADGGTGALRFAAGGHRLGPRPVVVLHDGAPQRARASLTFDEAAWPAFAPASEAGDAVAFTPVTIHASPAMRRPGERAAGSCISLSPRARSSHANALNHPLCKVVADGAPFTELPHA